VLECSASAGRPRAVPAPNEANKRLMSGGAVIVATVRR